MALPETNEPNLQGVWTRMQPVSASNIPFSVIRDSSSEEEASGSGRVADDHEGQATSLAHRFAEVSLEPVVPAISAPFTTNPAQGIKYLNSIPRPQLARLLVDGELLRREKGVGCYERREPRCLETLCQGWGLIIDWLKKLEPGEVPVITSENLSELHKVVAAHNSNFFPGEFVKPDDKYMLLPLSHSNYSDITYFDAEGLLEAEDIYEQHIAQCRLSDKQAQKKAAFIVAYDDKRIRLSLSLGKNVTAELFRNIEDPEAIRDILVAHKQNKLEASYEYVQQFYSIMAEHLDRKTSSCFGRLRSGNKEGKVLDTLKERLTRNFTGCVRRKTPPCSELEMLTENTLLRLNQALAQCRSEADLIRTVCRFTTEFQQLHPFQSVNGRTFTLLLQFLLMAYGLPPAIFKNPESFVCCGQEGLAADLRTAIENTRAAMQLGHMPGFSLHGYATPADDEEYDNVCVDLESVIKGDRPDQVK